MRRSSARGRWAAASRPALAERGVPVTIIDTSAEALERGLKTIRGNWQRQVDKGKLSAAARRSASERIRTTTTYDDAGVAAADIAVEAVFERMSIKQTVLKQLDGAGARRARS